MGDVGRQGVTNECLHTCAERSPAILDPHSLFSKKYQEKGPPNLVNPLLIRKIETMDLVTLGVVGRAMGPDLAVRSVNRLVH